MRKFFVFVASLGLLWLLTTFLTWDRTPPAVSWVKAPATVGKTTRIVLEVEDTGRGLESLEVDLIQDDTRRELISETYPGSWLPWRAAVSHRSLVLDMQSFLADFPLREGELELAVRASDQPKLWFFRNRSENDRTFRLDLTPPRIDVLSQQHYIRQGGSETILYRVSEPGRSGVRVGERLFVGYPLPDRGEGVHLCIFALAHDDSHDLPMFVWAEDEAGNRSQVSFWKRTFPSRFRQRTLQLSDSFMEKVVDEILSNTSEVQRKGSLLESYLAINGPLREINNNRIAEISRRSADRRLWDGPFLQLSHSQVEASFADHRTYVYQGREVDRQTHLGFDLASVAQSPVEAANDGVVLFAGYLGIYGNSIIVDHGLGLSSLYSHLSSIDVSEGEPVRRGQILGRTGETGLAGGDHLHFSTIVQGVQVNPLEWWDERWIRQRVLER